MARTRGAALARVRSGAVLLKYMDQATPVLLQWGTPGPWGPQAEGNCSGGATRIRPRLAASTEACVKAT
eukprot:scaffold105822_cov42-Phaeocystis_antarctica.AAC.1